MKLFLTSYRVPVPQALFDVVGKPADQISMAIITNAKDYYIPKARAFKTQEAVKFFKDLGIAIIDEIDLRTYTNDGKLKADLSSYDLIWANGGNTFMLMEAIENSGFASVIRDLLQQGVVYGGESAGAIVAGSSLKGIELADIPEFADAQIWEGMKLIDAFIMPHIDNPQYQDRVEPAVNMNEGAQVILLKDSQILVVEGENQKVITGDNNEG